MKKLIAICLLCATPALAQTKHIPPTPPAPDRPAVSGVTSVQNPTPNQVDRNTTISLTIADLDLLISAEIDRRKAEQSNKNAASIYQRIQSQLHQSAPASAEEKK